MLEARAPPPSKYNFNSVEEVDYSMMIEEEIEEDLTAAGSSHHAPRQQQQQQQHPPLQCAPAAVPLRR